MTDKAYIVSRTLERKIAFAENDKQYTVFITLDVLKEILYVLEEQEEEIKKLKEIMEDSNG